MTYKEQIEFAFGGKVEKFGDFNSKKFSTIKYLAIGQLLNNPCHHNRKIVYKMCVDIIKGKKRKKPYKIKKHNGVL